MLKIIFLYLCIFVSLSLGSVMAANTPTPSPAYTCKKTCTTERICEVPAKGKDKGTCPRAEICCEALTKPGVTAIPTPTIVRPLVENSAKLDPYICVYVGKEYHPLRPYPALGCYSHLIPIKSPEALINKRNPNLFLSFSCGKSANPEGLLPSKDVIEVKDFDYRFPPVNEIIGCLNMTAWSNTLACQLAHQVENQPHKTTPLLCHDYSQSKPHVCFLAKIVYDVTLDYSETTFPILGDTKDPKLSDRAKVNNYLSWYLNGVVLQSEGLNLNLKKITDVDRLINFSGPSLRLLSKESLASFRQTLKDWVTKDIHDYKTSTTQKVHNTAANSLKSGLTSSQQLAASVFEFAAEEDVTGETQPGLIKNAQPVAPEIDGQVVGINLFISGADSRLYFPHLRNTEAMAEYLTSTFKPAPDNPEVNPTEAAIALRKRVSQHFNQFQGIDDCTPIYQQWMWGKVLVPPKDCAIDRTYSNEDHNTIRTFSLRNTEVVPYSIAPTPMFTNYNDRFSSIDSQSCEISPAVTNSGDTLAGSAIHGQLTVYQVFEYAPQAFIAIPGTATCQLLGFNEDSSPSCKQIGLTCNALEGQPCINLVPGSAGSCCWGACPYLSECEKANTQNVCFFQSGCPSNTQNSLGLSCYGTGGHCCGPDVTGTTTSFCDQIPVPPAPSSCDATDCSTLTQAVCVSGRNSDCCKWTTNTSPGPIVLHPNPVCPKYPLVDLKAKSRIAIYVKTPFVQKIYDTLVEAPDSLLRRFLPYHAGIPTPSVLPPPPTPTPDYLKVGKRAIVGSGMAEYSSWANPTKGAKLKDEHQISFGGGSGGGPEIYFPKIGSLFEYLLGAGKDPLNLQCILRPQGFCQASKVCGELPPLPGTSGSCTLTSISPNVGTIPPALKQIVSAAGQAFHTPPNLILGIMYGEGLFNTDPRRFEWTDENVKNWATCEKIPGCNETGDDNFVGFNGSDFPDIIKRPNYQKVMAGIDPGRTEFSQCNLLDTIFALSQNLWQTSAGGFGKTGLQCFGINLYSDKWPTSCDWTNNQYASAIKVAENGYLSSCLTKENSCLLGGGLNAVCPSGDGCERLDNRYTDRSHFGCLWDVGHGK